MTSREEQFLALYRARRFDDQRSWYEARVDEYGRANDQVITVTGVALFGASAAGLAAASDLAGFRVGWAVIAAGMAALATLVDSYGQLIGYDQNAKVYRDALAALGTLHKDAPWLAGEGVAATSTADFVTMAEAVLQREISQWGQLAPQTTGPSEPTDE
jgi:hypothetical protein